LDNRGYIGAGLVFFVVFMLFAYKMWLFENVSKWPAISQVALFCGPLLLAAGLCLSTRPPTYAMIVPLAVYGLLSIAGGLALVGKFNTRDVPAE